MTTEVRSLSSSFSMISFLRDRLKSLRRNTQKLIFRIQQALWCFASQVFSISCRNELTGMCGQATSASVITSDLCSSASCKSTLVLLGKLKMAFRKERTSLKRSWENCCIKVNIWRTFLMQKTPRYSLGIYNLLTIKKRDSMNGNAIMVEYNKSSKVLFWLSQHLTKRSLYCPLCFSVGIASCDHFFLQTIAWYILWELSRTHTYA